MKKRKKWRLRKAKQDNIPKDLEGFHPMIARLLYLRGIDSREEAEMFFNPDYKEISDPFDLPDMDKAVDRIVRARHNKEKITIYADYDADAVTAAAVLMRFFRKADFTEVDYYIPDRFEEGYGMNTDAIEKMAKNNTDLIISVDTGTNATEAIKRAKGLGMDVIITDHHKITDELPSADAVINPQRLGENHDLTVLTGVGVAFKLVQGLVADDDFAEYKDWEKWLLDLVAIGTIADMQALLGENRTLVKWGIHVIQKTKWVGLNKLIDVCGAEPGDIDSYTIGFYIAPRINAAGRIDHAKIALDLLLTDDSTEAERLAGRLDKLNTKRQDLTEQIYSEAKEQVLTQGDKFILFGLGEGWHKGVLGLVAGRISKQYNRPAVIASSDGEVIDGSARSIESFDITEALGAAESVLDTFGGHKQAAGFSLPAENWDEFVSILSAKAEKSLNEDDLSRIIKYDVEFDLDQAEPEILDFLENFAPHGISNPKPALRSDEVRVADFRLVGADQTHLKMTLERNGTTVGGIGFGLGYWADKLQESDGLIDLIYHLEYNHWNGRKNIQAKIIDLRIRKTND